MNTAQLHTIDRINQLSDEAAAIVWLLRDSAKLGDTSDAIAHRHTAAAYALAADRIHEANQLANELWHQLRGQPTARKRNGYEETAAG